MTPSTAKSLSTRNTTLAAKSELAVVLVEPRIPQNTGNIARLCACTGAELYLVGDLGFRLSNKYLGRAGMDYMDSVEIHHLPSFEALLAEKPGWVPCYVDTYATQCYTDYAYPPKSLLIFGSETQGLPQQVVFNNPDTSVRIPMVAGVRSLNLSTSVAIVLYEAIRQHTLAS
jgi:tRNA (cytidine/uridine-2'-O-)-methyltransferase